MELEAQASLGVTIPWTCCFSLFSKDNVERKHCTNQRLNHERLRICPRLSRSEVRPGTHCIPDCRPTCCRRSHEPCDCPHLCHKEGCFPARVTISSRFQSKEAQVPEEGDAMQAMGGPSCQPTPTSVWIHWILNVAEAASVSLEWVSEVEKADAEWSLCYSTNSLSIHHLKFLKLLHHNFTPFSPLPHKSFMTYCHCHRQWGE